MYGILYVSEISVEIRKSDDKCDSIMIESELWDTVPYCRDLTMTMEAIMTRDQRTTSHRVLERGEQTNGSNATIPSINKKLGVGKIIGAPQSVTSSMNVGPAIRARVYDIVDYANSMMRDTTASSTVKLLCDMHSCLCDCRSCIRRIERGLMDRSHRRKNPMVARASTAHRHKSNSTTRLRLGSLLVILLVVSVQGAPTTMSLEDRRMNSPPKWVNPCGLAAEDFDGDLDVVQLKDEQLLGQVVVQAKTALDHAQLFRDDYIKRTFSTDFEDMKSNWQDNHYDWLPGLQEIPKQLGEHLEQEYLDRLEVRLLDTALLDAYEYMQRYAVGLEQIVWDQEDHRLDFRQQFKDTEYKLRTVLCELQVALVERGVAPRPDITRDAMSREYRSLSDSATFRNLRDWLIFRDYMNGLEYIVEVFEHLRRGLES